MGTGLYTALSRIFSLIFLIYETGNSLRIIRILNRLCMKVTIALGCSSNMETKFVTPHYKVKKQIV